MKNLLLVLLLSTTVQLSQAQVADGIYVIPEFDAYSAVISNGDVVKGYFFTVDDGKSTVVAGSRVGDTIEYVEDTDGQTVAARVVGGPLGVTVEDIFCIADNEEDSEGCSDRPKKPFRALPVLKANGSLKSIYRTQWGADMLLFDSDGIAVILIFENGDDDDRAWIGAYTASISDDLAIFNLETVVETGLDEEDDVVVTFELQLSDVINPQASFENITCEVAQTDDQDATCNRLVETYFSSIIRIF